MNITNMVISSAPQVLAKTIGESKLITEAGAAGTVLTSNGVGNAPSNQAIPPSTSTEVFCSVSLTTPFQQNVPGTNYQNVFNISDASNATEANVQFPMPLTGTIVEWGVQVKINTVATSETLTLRKAAGDMAGSSISLAGGTGVKEATGMSVAVTIGDLIDFKCVTVGAGNLTITGVWFRMTV